MLALLSLPSWSQRIWQVSPDGRPFSLPQALQKAGDGDTIELASGDYPAPSAVIAHRRLTLRGATPRPRLLAAGQSAEGKAIWVVRGGEIRIDNLEFHGARVPDRNGAGIRLERGKLWLRSCVFVDNEMALMTANDADIELHIEDSHFEHAVRSGAPLAHLLYVGSIGELSIRGSRFHHSEGGHLIKSRARRSWLAYNLVRDGPRGRASYEIEFPNGGDATLIGNIVVQSTGSQNNALIAYGAEGLRWTSNRLRLAHNTLINEQTRPAEFVKLWPERVRPEELLMLNNLSQGAGKLWLPPPGRMEGNWSAQELARLSGSRPGTGAQPMPPGSAPRVRIKTLVGSDAMLRPDAEFRWPIGTQARDSSEPLATPGALQGGGLTPPWLAGSSSR